VTLYVVPERATRMELYFEVDQLANMESLVAALTDAGMQSG